MQANLVVLSGASADVPGQFGAASMTAAMLDEGAAGKAALAVADSVEFLGAQLSTSAGFDASVVRLSTPAAKLRESLDLLADVAFRPDFPTEELERLRTERLTGLLQARDDPAALVGLAFPRLLFGPEHRYGTAGRRHRDLAQGARRRRTARLPSRPLPARQRRADRGGRHDACRADAAARAALRHVAGRRAACRAVPSARLAAARQAADLPGGQARGRAVADSHRPRRRVALHHRLHRARRAQHHSRRLLHLAPQPEPAREERLHLRRHVALRHAARSGPVPGGRRRADRQDGRGAEGVLQRAHRHPRAHSRRRTGEGEELRRAQLRRRVRDHRTAGGEARRDGGLRAARRRVLHIRGRGAGRERGRTRRASPSNTCCSTAWRS